AMVYRLENAKLVRAGPNIYGGDPWKFRQGAKYPLPEAGLYSTAHDLFILYQMMLNGGIYDRERILSRPSVEMMTLPHTGDLETGAKGFGWGLGWSIVRDAIGMLPLTSVGTYGHAGGFGTYGWIDLKKELVGVFLIARPGPSDERSAFMVMAAAAII